MISSYMAASSSRSQICIRRHGAESVGSDEAIVFLGSCCFVDIVDLAIVTGLFLKFC
jgi:hypothetical protein